MEWTSDRIPGEVKQAALRLDITHENSVQRTAEVPRALEGAVLEALRRAYAQMDAEGMMVVQWELKFRQSKKDSAKLMSLELFADVTRNGRTPMAILRAALGLRLHG